MQRQDFQGVVSQAIQAATASVTQINVANNGKPLTRQERNQLNSKVELLTTRFGKSGKETWLFLHRTIGVNSISEMTSEHRDAAHGLLDLLLDVAEKTEQLSKLQQDLQGLPSADVAQRLQREMIRVNELLATQERLEMHFRIEKQKSESKSKLLKNLIWLASLLSGATLVLGFFVTSKAGIADFYAGSCSLNGKRYDIGSTASGMACIKSSDGAATLVQAQTASKPQQPIKK